MRNFKVLTAAALAVGAVWGADPFVWTAKNVATFADGANWQGGRAPGAADGVKPGPAQWNLGGGRHAVGSFVYSGWEDLYPVCVSNGTLVVRQWRSRSTHVTVAKDGVLVFPKGGLWVGGDGMGDDRWDRLAVAAGGRCEMRGAFIPWHADFTVAKGGTFTLAPEKTDFAGSWFAARLVNEGTLEIPQDLAVSPSGKLGGGLEIRQAGGTLRLGGRVSGFAQDTAHGGAVKVVLAGGRVEATGQAGFDNCTVTRIEPGATIELFVAEGASFDLSPFAFGRGAKVVKTGLGAVVTGKTKPAGLVVKEGPLVCLPRASAADVPEGFSVSRPDAEKWTYEPRVPLLAPTAAASVSGGALHGRHAGLVRLTAANAAGDESQKRWRAAAWRNEGVHGQFVVWSRPGASRLRARVSALRTADGEELPASAVSTRFVRHVLGHLSSKGVQISPEELYGDCLDDAEQVDLPAKGYRPVWLTVRVPKTAKPGVYRGRLTIVGNAADAVEFPLELAVRARTLPDPRDWKFFLDLWQSPGAVARYHGVKLFSPEHWRLLEPYLRELAVLGQRVITTTVRERAWGQANNFDIYPSMVEWIRKKDGTWTWDYAVFDAYVEFAKKCGLGPQIHCYTLAGFGVSYTDAATGEKDVTLADAEARRAVWRLFLKDLEAHARAKGWLGDVYLALDESEPETLRAAEKLLHGAAPRLKIAMAGNKNPSEYKGVKIDNYCQYIGHVTPKFLAEAAERKKQGLTTTFYVCCGPGRPNTFLQSPLCESVWQGLYATATGLDGFLRWAAFTWPRDPLQDASFGNWRPGDTFLLYPGPRLSARWEMLRDGFEAAEKIRILRAEGAATPALEALLDPKTFQDTEAFYAARTAAILAEVDRLDATCADWTVLPVVPTPREWKRVEGTWRIPARLKVDAAGTAAGAALVADWNLAFGAGSAAAVAAGAEADVVFARGAAGAFAEEAYRLETAARGVRIAAGAEKGFYWATRTLLQLARASRRELPCGTIEDAPKYRLRGFMLDVARKPYSIDFLRAVAKDMAYYKMNTFHVHLNDDGASEFTGREKAVRAFRLESETYPGLAAADHHYTKKEFRAFVKEAAAMGVTVIPEIDSPAHAGCFAAYYARAGRKDRFSILGANFTNTVQFIEKLYDEYLAGDDPVFAGPYVHIGMDEYGTNHVAEFRAWGRELARIVRGHGKKACIWGAAEHPERPEGELLVDIWSAGGTGTNSYDPLKMMAAGYDVCCTQGGHLYIVPSSGYYHDYLDVKWLHGFWEPCTFGPRSKTVPDNPRLFGGKFAVWNDLSGNGTSEDDTFDRVFPAIGTVAQKTWSGTREDVDWETFSDAFAATREAPGVNLADRYEGPASTTVGWSQGGGYSVSFEINPASGRTREATLFDDGFSRVTLAADGRLGFFRDGLGHVFATKIPDGKWTAVRLDGDPDGVNLHVGGVYRESTKGLCRFCPNWCGRGYSLYLRAPRTLHFPLVRQAFPGEIRNLAVKTGRVVTVLGLDADAYRGPDGFADVAKMAHDVNASGADAVILRHARTDGPVEGGNQPKKGEAGVLAFRCCFSGTYGGRYSISRATDVEGVEKETVHLVRDHRQGPVFAREIAAAVRHFEEKGFSGRIEFAR